MSDIYEMWLCSQIQEPEVLKKLLGVFSSAEEIFRCGRKKMTELSMIPENIREKLLKNASERELERLQMDMDRFRVRFVGKGEDGFPKRLLPYPDCPFGLFYQGRLPGEIRPALAIVGARGCSSYGEEMARYFSRELAKEGVQVISGLAMGIDGISHRGAIDGGGDTYGILGSGIGTPYPKENWNLYHQMLENGGVISEYPPHTPALKYHFPKRNRLISGVSDGVLVIEAREQSGTSITVDRALEQGKDVYTIPGRLTDPLSRGCNQLIQQGARLVLSAEEILSELSGQFPFFRREKMPAEDSPGGHREMSDKQTEESDNSSGALEIDLKNFLKNSLATDEKMVYACLRLNLRHFDSLIEETGLTPSSLATVLYSLEAKGLVRQPAPNYYAAVYRM